MVAPTTNGFIKNAIYLSHTSLKDFANCPRAYYLKNLYKDPTSGHKLQIASPYLTLGITIHDTIQWFCKQSSKPNKEDFEMQFRELWKKYRGKRGGFSSLEDERSFGMRGLQMIHNFYDNAECLEECTPNPYFPKFNLLPDVVLIGNADYIGKKEDGTLSIVDFKTGTKDEDSPLQLYIYAILAEANLQKDVTSAAFWYLDRDSEPKEVVLDPLDTTINWLKGEAGKIHEAIQKGEWTCKRNPGLCRDCREYQALIDGKGEFLYPDFKFKKDVYALDRTTLSIGFEEVADTGEGTIFES